MSKAPDSFAKLAKIKEQLKSWAKTKYGHKNRNLNANAIKMNDLENRLMAQPFNPILRKHMDRLIKQRENILLFGHHNWKGNSRKTWLSQGDHNTIFFYQKMAPKVPRNTIF